MNETPAPDPAPRPDRAEAAGPAIGSDPIPADHVSTASGSTAGTPPDRDEGAPGSESTSGNGAVSGNGGASGNGSAAGSRSAADDAGSAGPDPWCTQLAAGPGTAEFPRATRPARFPTSGSPTSGAPTSGTSTSRTPELGSPAFGAPAFGAPGSGGPAVAVVGARHGWAPGGPPEPLRGPVPPPAPVLRPGPAAPPSLRVLGVAGVAGLVALFSIPDDRPGLGWTVLGLTLLVGGYLVGWRPSRCTAGWALAAVALGVVPAVRDADWLVWLCLPAAAGCASIAVAGGSSTPHVVRAAFAGPVAALRSIPWVLGARSAMRGRGAPRIAAAVLVAGLLVLVFGSLLVSADAAFAALVDGLVPEVNVDVVFGWGVRFALGALTLLGMAFLMLSPVVPPRTRPAPPLRGLEWTLPVGLLVVLFAVFVGVQIVTLASSDEHVLQTTGLTYAEYARSGFWQLLAVGLLTLGVVLTAARFAPTGTPVDRAWKRGLLAALTVLAVLMVVSALGRMWLYQQAYGLTVLRLLVLTCEIWLGASFVALLVGVLRLRTTGVVRLMVAAGVVALLGLAVLDGDRLVAAQNVERFERTGDVDTYYLSQLSTDALPALQRLPEPERSCAVDPILSAAAPLPGETWGSLNLSRAHARALGDPGGWGCDLR